ncbi:MAG TPA: GIY-YIG nuclease family protein [Flavobacteriales bacterium]
MKHHNYFVYILRCADGLYYTGVTNDVDTRVTQHQEGTDPNSWTFKRRPVELVLVEWFQDIRQAIDREKQLKGWSRKKKEALIAGDEAALSYHALAYERRTFPPLTFEQVKRVQSASTGSA